MITPDVMRIEPATTADLAAIRAAYEHGRAMQRATASTVWPEFSEESIRSELDAGRLLRIVDDKRIAGVFTVAYEDAAIWGSLERGAHVYLHRIARASWWTGQGIMDAVLSWAIDRCHALTKEGIRVDTWANNAPLIAFYERRGFRLIARRRLDADPRLPAHYHGNEFALLERAR